MDSWSNELLRKIIKEANGERYEARGEENKVEIEIHLSLSKDLKY